MLFGEIAGGEGTRVPDALDRNMDARGGGGGGAAVTPSRVSGARWGAPDQGLSFLFIVNAGDNLIDHLGPSPEKDHIVSWAAVMNRHKLSSLKQRECILLQIWRSEVYIKVSAGCCFPSGGSGESVPSPSQSTSSHLHSRLQPLPLSSKHFIPTPAPSSGLLSHRPCRLPLGRTLGTAPCQRIL